MNFWRRGVLVFCTVTVFSMGALAGCEEHQSSWPRGRNPRKISRNFPDWTFSMRLWPFDILTPTMRNSEIKIRLKEAKANNANSLIFYIEVENMFRTFVDTAGFQGVLGRIRYLTSIATSLNLKTIVYVNGLEVMTRGAFDANCKPTGVPTMALVHPDWLQRDLGGKPIVHNCQDVAWLQPDWEDAWLSPYSGYRDLLKTRIKQLANAGVNGVYFDAVFLPGFQSDHDHFRWGSSDAAFAQAFTRATGFTIPNEPDLESQAFRAFLSFRHDAVADYLYDLAQIAWENGLVAFWESSSNDTIEGTLLGNETAVTGRCGLGFSPEVEPQGDWLAAFRMGKAARELNQERPLIYLSWPNDQKEATKEFAVAIAHSNNYYPTADIPLPKGAFDLLYELQTVFDRRVAYGGNVGLIYSVRNKDFTYQSESHFTAYVEAFQRLVLNHVPFRIIPLEYLVEDGLEGLDTVVIPGLQGISEEEGELLSQKQVVELGVNVGTRDQNWKIRESPMVFERMVGLDKIQPALPFGLEAPKGTFIEYYGDRDGAHRMYLFAFSPSPSGKLVLSAKRSSEITATTYRLAGARTKQSGVIIEVNINSFLIVVVASENDALNTLNPVSLTKKATFLWPGYY